MTKKEMIDKMIVLGITTEENRSNLMRRTKSGLEEIYNWSVAKRVEYLANK